MSKADPSGMRLEARRRLNAVLAEAPTPAIVTVLDALPLPGMCTDCPNCSAAADLVEAIDNLLRSEAIDRREQMRQAVDDALDDLDAAGQAPGVYRNPNARPPGWAPDPDTPPTWGAGPGTRTAAAAAAGWRVLVDAGGGWVAERDLVKVMSVVAPGTATGVLRRWRGFGFLDAVGPYTDRSWRIRTNVDTSTVDPPAPS